MDQLGRVWGVYETRALRWIWLNGGRSHSGDGGRVSVMLPVRKSDVRMLPEC
jgi:hypothetical protein